ncbi:MULTISPECIES: acyltransferase [unclassified Pseudomonas]|uniref:acyltransferase family protein n=1 Tax=unclassified Pseudomonas TaxID=196821 RepID=UPI00087124A2|nr:MULTISPECIES: acyltransferase [unclassified Pseudomonas]SCW62997.1 Peptidoglycan/LPS O-acetylase OafA/YrhL, contains acyltransferase and SGNH-hydrolase domains [Pseudomonas sp. NFACC05-1]SFL60930.1 Peptidoglycan/LPS O-acetylase OafA/YrhL, contains acyltransferase and SGNH-hydrolase domains [Pseudomonas sp. NFACC46-3]
MHRVNSIDYMRGLLALCVMFYHFMSWSIGTPDSSTTLGRLGVYAVSTFYIISGISLYLAYSDLKFSRQNLLTYVTKRFFRIAPLYWIATLLTGLYLYLATQNFTINWEKYISNLTLTFGYYHPKNYIPVGGWSIGNEMVFYALFPFLVASAKHKWSYLCASLALGSIYFYFSSHLLTPEQSLAQQWVTYINPFNQAFLFAIGVGIGMMRKSHVSANNLYPMTALVFACIAFIYWPVDGNQINIVTGFNRAFFTFTCGIACWSVLNLNIKSQKYTTPALKFIGDISYSVYLLHGAALFYTSEYLLPLFYSSPTPYEKLQFFCIITLPLTITLSYFIYRLIEKPFINLGRHLTNQSRQNNLSVRTTTGQ